jgi:hypothetical protein
MWPSRAAAFVFAPGPIAKLADMSAKTGDTRNLNKALCSVLEMDLGRCGERDLKARFNPGRKPFETVR